MYSWNMGYADQSKVLNFILKPDPSNLFAYLNPVTDCMKLRLSTNKSLL
jgi:hypothetical protein